MAGSRQHILPRFLLKGFASRATRRSYFTWVFRKDAEALETNIINVAVSKDFYELADSASVDDRMSEFESKAAQYVDAWRRRNATGRIDPARATDLVSHLLLRTRWIRELPFREMVNGVRRLLASLSTPRGFTEFMLAYIENNPDIAKEDLAAAFRKQGIPEPYVGVFYDYALKLLPTVIRAQSERAAGEMRLASQSLEPQYPRWKKESHANLLSRDVTASPRANLLRKLEWYVCVSRKHALVLGDFGPITRLADGTYKVLWDKTDTIGAVCLPISATHVIVGQADEDERWADAEKLNVQIARCSLEFFVSSANTPALRRLARGIGRQAYVLAEGKLRDIVDGVARGKGGRKQEDLQG